MSEPEYVVVETIYGDGIVAVVHEGTSVPRDVAPDLEPLPLADAQELADILNEGDI